MSAVPPVDPTTTPPESQVPVPAAEAPNTLDHWLYYPVLDNPLMAWLLALVVLALIFFAGRILRDMVSKQLARSTDVVSSRLGHLPDKIIADIRAWCIFAIALFAATRVLSLPQAANGAIRLILIIAVSVQVLVTSRLVVDFVIRQAMSRAKLPDGQPDPSIASASGIIRFMTTLVLGALLILLGLANMGVEVTPLITGLGIGGIAVALAAQSILGDLFGSLTILFDKPFLVGDYIVVGDKMGTVESIGVKTTRIRALSGEQLVFANSDLLSSRIQNFKRMQERRVVFAIGIVYETPVQKLELVQQILAESIRHQKGTRLDRAHFKGFGAYSLDFETVYYVLMTDLGRSMDIQQAINIEIMRRFEQEGIEFAYPTQVGIVRPERPATAEGAAAQMRLDPPR